MTTTFQAFKDRVLGDLLPTFCNHPSRGWGCGGFKEDWTNISERDAADFLMGLDAGLIEHQGRGQYLAPKSLAKEQFFWSGRKSVSPRPVSLWIEPIITVAALARLHFTWGWPKEHLGTQSQKWEFDVTAYREADPINEYLACEVKKTVSELDQMVHLMQHFAVAPPAVQDLTLAKHKNAFRKLEGLQRRRALIFWALGPNGSNRVFRMTYTDRGTAAFAPASDAALSYIGD